MFERANLFAHAFRGGEIGRSHTSNGRGQQALRAIEWSEITARLNAARDLRELVRSEARMALDTTAASFGDAAASYFQALDQSERVVNPNALEDGKPPCANNPNHNGNAAEGDRENVDD